MEEIAKWVIANGLALYGAVVGTAALAISLAKYIHTVRKDEVKLKISVMKHDEYDKGVEILKQNPDPATGNGWLPAYVVRVTNLGSITAHLQEISLVCDEGSMEGLCLGRDGFLVKVSEAPKKSIQAKDSQDYVVWNTPDTITWKPKVATVQDQTGKKWKRSARGL